jgi:4-alpha-glucanotransferase
LLRVVVEESQKHRCIFIGEDLGTVPEGFREIAAQWGLWSYRVMMFERHHDGSFKSPHEYPANALATFNTHDLPTFAGWTSGHDLTVRRALGLTVESDDDRARAKAALTASLSPYAENDDVDRITSAARFLAATPCRLVTMSVEDLLGMVEQVNIPGTVDQYPNWRRKPPVSVEQWAHQPVFAEIAGIFRRAGRAI